MTQNAKKVSSNEKYAYIVLDELTKSFRLTDREIESLQLAPSFQIVCATPFNAGSSQPLHNAVLHAGMYIQAMRNPQLFSLKTGESYDARIELGMQYPDGNPEVIAHAERLLKLISLNDYYLDQEDDAREGKYNPITEGDIHYFAERQRLEKEIAAAAPEVASLFPPVPTRSGWK